jgi:hypothetical protein
MTRSSLRSFVLLLLLAVPAAAYRREYVVTWEGKRMAGSEVCFYRGVRGDAYSLFLSPSDVRCLPADAVLDFPPGLIHTFARHKEGFASLQRDFTVYDGPPNPEHGYEKLQISLEKAGIVDFSAILKRLAVKQRTGLWVGSTPTSFSTFIPLVPGEMTVIAPAGVVLVPLIIENDAPIRAGEPLYLEPGEHHSASFASRSDESYVIMPVHLDADSVGDARSVLAAPEIALKSGDRIIHPIAPLYGPEESALLFFPHVPGGSAEVISGGSMWKAISHRVEVLPQPVTIVREALPLVAGGSIEVRWSTEGARESVSQCHDAHTSDVPMIRATLRRCAQAADGKNHCSTVANAKAPFASTAGLAFNGIPAGAYTLSVEPPDGKRQSVITEAITGRRATVDIKLPSFDFFGSVKVNGKPVHARLIFDSGQAVSDDEGHYMATLAADPRQSIVQVEPCGGDRTYAFIPRAAPTINAAYDIDVNMVRLRVKVIDAQQHPVANAGVGYGPVRQVLPEGIEPWFHSPEKLTAADGIADFDDLPEGFLISLCAEHKDFVTKCSNPVVDPKQLGEKLAVVQFDPVAMHGRVAGHTGQGYVVFVNPAGAVTDEIPLDAEGAFLSRSTHAAPEHVVYISGNRPLTVLPLPLAPPADLVLQIPAVPVRTFTVTVPGNRNDMGLLGTWIGGMYVPVQALNTHMELRGLDSVIHRGAALRVPDIAETGAIAVAFGALPVGTREFVDPFTLPQYAGVERHRVEGTAIELSP